MECKRCAGAVTVDELICGTCGRLNERSKGEQPGPEVTRGLVLDVVLRQAQSNPDWRRLCDLAMQVNNISDGDILVEADNRELRILPAQKPIASVPAANSQWTPGASESGTYPIVTGSAVDKLKSVQAKIFALAHQTDETAENMRIKLNVLCTELERCIVAVQSEVRAPKWPSTTAGTDRELHRTTGQPLQAPRKADDPYRVDL